MVGSIVKSKKGGLMQIRGDWAYYKQIFSFPAWANKKICWRCGAGKEPCDDFKDAHCNIIQINRVTWCEIKPCDMYM